MSAVLALDTDQMKTVGIGIIVAIVVVGFLISFLITKIIMKLVVLVVVLVLAGVVWQQRSSLIDKADACNFSPKFFGVTISLPDDLKAQCLQKEKELKK